jgi:glycosyltransferase involved in cell wall biosynthesis
MTALVSAIIPVYNGARFVGEALESVLAQTVDARIEIIVIDDASTDGSVELLRSRSDIELVRLPENSGPSVARNRGLAVAQGDYIAFLDADDLWSPGKTRIQLDWFEQRSAAGFVTGLQETFIEPGCHPPAWAYKMAAAPASGGVPSAWLLRRDVFKRVGRFDPSYRHAEDIDWLTRAAQAGIALESVDEVVFRKRVHDTNLTLESEPSQAGLFRALRSSALRQRTTPTQ